MASRSSAASLTAESRLRRLHKLNVRVHKLPTLIFEQGPLGSDMQSIQWALAMCSGWVVIFALAGLSEIGGRGLTCYAYLRHLQPLVEQKAQRS
jgi:hypothetical protein